MIKKQNITSSILVVDDEPEISQLIYCLLSDENYNVEIASNGKDVLKRRDLKDFDLFLLDVNMPAMNGYDLCYALKTMDETKESPVIFLTANCMPDEKVQGLDCGAVDYITKPFHGKELIARVRNHLEMKHTSDALREQALTDGLTKLYNHACTCERLGKEISNSRRHGLHLSLIMIDLDDFKLINDQYGHLQGDRVLKKVASTISSLIREEDIAGRYGGEEFIIILPNTDSASAYKVAEKIRKSVKNIKWEFGDLRITLSGGVYTLRDENVNEFIEQTDSLLYRAKNEGKDMIIAGENYYESGGQQPFSQASAQIITPTRLIP